MQACMLLLSWLDRAQGSGKQLLTSDEAQRLMRQADSAGAPMLHSHQLDTAGCCSQGAPCASIQLAVYCMRLILISYDPIISK